MRVDLHRRRLGRLPLAEDRRQHPPIVALVLGGMFAPAMVVDAAGVRWLLPARVEVQRVPAGPEPGEPAPPAVRGE